jgi:hypothetical protein
MVEAPPHRPLRPRPPLRHPHPQRPDPQRHPVPYIAHLLAVAATVLEYGGCEEVAIAALLHDAVEDQGGEPRLAHIRNRFGGRVAEIVRSCSDSVADTAAGPPKEDRRLCKPRGTSRRRQPAYGNGSSCVIVPSYCSNERSGLVMLVWMVLSR